MSIKGKPIGGPPAIPDFNQTDETAGGYIKNKPNMKEYLRLDGGTMTGELNVIEPKKDSSAVTKKYVDNYVDAKHFTDTATLSASGWSSSTPYTQTITVAGMLTTDAPHVSPVYSDTLDTAIAQQEAWAMVSKAEAEEGSITFTCFEDKPGNDIPIHLEVNR